MGGGRKAPTLLFAQLDDAIQPTRLGEVAVREENN